MGFNSGFKGLIRINGVLLYLLIECWTPLFERRILFLAVLLAVEYSAEDKQHLLRRIILLSYRFKDYLLCFYYDITLLISLLIRTGV